MIDKASVINLKETNSSSAATSTIQPSIYRGKLLPLIEKAKTEIKQAQSDVAISSALLQSLKSGDQTNIDWALAQDVSSYIILG